MGNQSKENYDEFLGFSRITDENWLVPDRKNYPPFGMSEQRWIKFFLEPQLDKAVPKDVIKVFEIARAAMIYSWLFYPLATLGLEQCTRIAEFAIHERCLMSGQKPGKFFENIATLVKAGVISARNEPRWQAIRQLRNGRSHLKSYMLIDTGQAIGYLETIAELINALFLSAPKQNA